MFRTIKNEDQKALRAESQGLMNKLYEKINEHYKTINRELINDIVNRRAFGSGRSL